MRHCHQIVCGNRSSASSDNCLYDHRRDCSSVLVEISIQLLQGTPS